MIKILISAFCLLSLSACTMQKLNPENTAYPQNITESHTKTVTVVPVENMSSREKTLESNKISESKTEVKDSLKLVVESNGEVSNTLYLKIVDQNDPLSKKIQEFEKNKI